MAGVPLRAFQRDLGIPLRTWQGVWARQGHSDFSEVHFTVNPPQNVVPTIGRSDSLPSVLLVMIERLPEMLLSEVLEPVGMFYYPASRGGGCRWNKNC